MPDDPPPAPDAPLPDDVPTDEASIHAAIARYFDALPHEPVMTAGLEDD